MPDKEPTNEIDQFLAAAVADPSDPSPRLMLADWLSERGDPRGELVMIQEQLRSIDVPRRDELEGRMVVRHDCSKAKRDDMVPLHPVVVDHLRKLTDVGLLVFEWPYRFQALLDWWRELQEASGIHLPCDEAGQHACTPSRHVYGFHALKKACGT